MPLGVIVGDGGDMVMQDVSFDDVVEEVLADGSEVAVDSAGGAAGESPCCGVVVRERGVRVVEVG